MTTIYLMRHSKSFKPNNINNNDSLQVQNEKWVLSVEGEELARNKSLNEELQDFDIVFSSNYTRAICTAKYFTKDEINIQELFGERKIGINSWDEKIEDFEQKQMMNHDYKIGDGESLNEVFEREEKAFDEILNNYPGKKILIVGHSTAIAVLLSKWCEINYPGVYKYKGNKFFDGNWKHCETFKLMFNDAKELISIENIK